MASSVTVDDDLRKRIKKLAADRDTTQGEIIRLAIELYENYFQTPPKTDRSEIRVKLKRIIDAQPKENWKEEIRQKLSAPGIEIDDLRMELSDVQ